MPALDHLQKLRLAAKHLLHACQVQLCSAQPVATEARPFRSRATLSTVTCVKLGVVAATLLLAGCFQPRMQSDTSQSSPGGDSKDIASGATLKYAKGPTNGGRSGGSGGGHNASGRRDAGNNASAAPASIGGPLGKGLQPVDFGPDKPSRDVRFVANWVVDSGDNQDMSFVILDKKNTWVYVFDTKGRRLGSSPVLIGAAKGDHTVPGIGQRPLSQVKPEEKTTPAGRFIAEPGTNMSGEDIVWVDYDAAVSMHRVRATNPKERRLERLASLTTKDNRISFGCINMPPKFYENVLSPRFDKRHGVVYVLPEVKTLAEVFPGVYDSAKRNRNLAAARTRGEPKERLIQSVSKKEPPPHL